MIPSWFGLSMGLGNSSSDWAKVQAGSMTMASEQRISEQVIQGAIECQSQGESIREAGFGSGGIAQNSFDRSDMGFWGEHRVTVEGGVGPWFYGLFGN